MAASLLGRRPTRGFMRSSEDVGPIEELIARPFCAGAGLDHRAFPTTKLWNRGASKLSLWVSAVSPLASGCRHWPSSCLSQLRRHGLGPPTSPRRSLATEPKNWVLFLSASR
jgi:hypothetical protein